MKYYIITPRQAETLAVAEHRYGNAADGYLCNIGDLAVYGPERAVSEGAREVSRREATLFVKQHQ